MAGITKTLAGEKVPYLVTILFASASWMITYFVDRVDKSPTVTYVMRDASEGSGRRVIVDVQNITRTVGLKDLTFSVRIEQGDQATKITHGEKWPEAPAWDGADAPNWEAGNKVDFPIARLQPGWRFRLVADYSGAGIPRLYLTQSADAARLVEPNIETAFANHELLILSLLLGIYSLFLCLVVWRGSLPESRDDDGT